MATLIYDGNDANNTVNQNIYAYDEIYTYGGNDKITLSYSDTYVEAGTGNDKVVSYIEGDNSIFLGTGNDTYTGLGFSDDDALFDDVHGGDGTDTFNISTAISIYYGDAGNDVFNSVGFWNTINGGSGRDTVSYQLQDSDPDLAGAGVEINLGSQFADTSDGRIEDLISIENAKGTSYADTITGSSIANELWGMKGNDILEGAAGDDDLYGGLGSDDLYGGTGADYFIFQSIKDSVVGTNRDFIGDFSRSQGDKIDLSDIDAITGGNDSKFTFIGSNAFTDTAGELRFSGNILSGDVNGDGKADFQIEVDSISSMKSSDFIL
jgi:Ca2+-binding RTX toxin-like protein